MRNIPIMNLETQLPNISDNHEYGERYSVQIYPINVYSICRLYSFNLQKGKCCLLLKSFYFWKNMFSENT